MIEAMHSEPEADAAAVGRLFGSALIQGGELWMSTHKELLANIGAILEGWLQFNRAALDTSSRTLQRLHECQTLAELLQLQREWASGYWPWTAATVPAAVEDSINAWQKALIRAREPAEAARAEIRIQREPATAAD